MPEPCLAPDKIKWFIRKLNGTPEDVEEVMKYIIHYDLVKKQVIVRICGNTPESYYPVQLNLGEQP